MASAKILLFTHKKLSDGSYPIVLQIIKDRKRKLISLGHSATKLQWDEEGNKPNKKHPNYSNLNLVLQKKLMLANKAILELEEIGNTFTVEDIVYKLTASSSNITIFKYTEGLIARLKRTGKIGNAIVYQTTLNSFKKFRKDIDLGFNQLSFRVVKDFEGSMLEKKIRLNSISVYLRTLRAIYNYAIRDKVAQQSLYPFKDLRIKSEITSKRAISKKI